MRISNCIECNEYKYIEKNGKCRTCINNKKIHIGNKNNTKIFLDKSDIYRNINITGMVGSGKTTLMNHLVDEIITDDFSLFYFDYLVGINSQDFDYNNIRNINIGLDKTINLFTPYRQKEDSNYMKEIDMTSELIIDIIDMIAEDNIKNVYILKQIICVVLNSDNMCSFKDLYFCLIDESRRCSAINNCNNIRINKKLIKKLKNSDISQNKNVINAVHILSEEFDNIFIDKSSRNLRMNKIVSNNDKIIFNLTDLHHDKSEIISLIIIKQLFDEIQLQGKKNNLFCIDGLDNSLSDNLEKEYRWSRHLKTSFISTFSNVSEINSTVLNNAMTNISFRLISENIKMSQILNVNHDKLTTLPVHQYIVKNECDIHYPLELDI